MLSLSLLTTRCVFAFSKSKHSPHSSKDSSTSHQTGFHLYCQSFYESYYVLKYFCGSYLQLPLCILSWDVTKCVLNSLMRDAQWLAMTWILTLKSSSERANDAISSRTQWLRKKCEVVKLWSHLQSCRRGAVLEFRCGAYLWMFSVVLRIWPKSYPFSPFITQRDYNMYLYWKSAPLPHDQIIYLLHPAKSEHNAICLFTWHF